MVVLLAGAVPAVAIGTVPFTPAGADTAQARSCRAGRAPGHYDTVETVPKTTIGDETLLVCLPPSGTGRSFFRSWPRRIGTARILFLSRPGHEERMREPLAGSLGQIADDVVARLSQQGARRVVLFGHSLGATVAFETARRLQDDPTLAVAGVVLSARQAPHLPGPRLPSADDDELLATVAPWGGYAEPPDESVRSLLLPMLRADLTSSAHYRWDGHRVALPLTTVAWSGDAVVEASAVRQWSAATTGPVRHETLEGNHFTAREAPAALVRLVASVIDPAGVTHA